MNVRAWRRGWRTELLPDLVAHSTRPTGSRTDRDHEAYSFGQRAYNLGRPLWQVCLLGAARAARGSPGEGLAWIRGYAGEALRRGERLGDPEVIRYYRRDRPKEWVSILAARVAGRPSRHR
jgi:hypothetical protein